MNQSTQKKIEVHAHWVGMQEPILMGALLSNSEQEKMLSAFRFS